VPPERQLLELLCGHWIVQAIACAARFKIADALAHGASRSADLAEACGADEDSLYRLLRALASIGIFTESAPRTFAMTPLAEPLCSSAPGSLREVAMMVGSEWEWYAHRHIDHSIATGRPAFEHVHSAPVFEWLATQPAAAANFDRAMAAHARYVHAAVADAYDFAGADTVVDVGGGYGSLLRAILDRTPDARGILLDLPHVVASAFRNGFVDDRIELVAGDFLTAVPAADTYVLSSVIHHWDDSKATNILRNVRAAIAREGRVVLTASIVGDAHAFVKLLDLDMLVVFGGRERTESEYRSLLAGADFDVTRIVETSGPTSVIEARPRD
jgi:hypothetical protein